jgi:general secretion pathway protein I
MRADPPHAAAGFTLIETIVALVILATAVVAFYGFLSSELNGAKRVEAAATDYDRRMNALELATALNPMAHPQGSIDLGAYHIAWSSQLLGQLHQSNRFPAGRGAFKVALYRMTFSFPGSTETRPISVTRLGYRHDGVPTTALGAGR